MFTILLLNFNTMVFGLTENTRFCHIADKLQLHLHVCHCYPLASVMNSVLVYPPARGSFIKQRQKNPTVLFIIVVLGSEL